MSQQCQTTLNESASTLTFEKLNLSQTVLRALKSLGYKLPTPIQAEAIPYFLAGNDILGQAQTGTGKTAAFALPILNNVDFSQRKPQSLILAPTRELAIQIVDAFKEYGSGFAGLKVMAIYGGQSYEQQIRTLKRGVSIVVGTPGRVMDLIEKNALDLSDLKVLVLDEADEMLRMGFIDDVEWILERAPKDIQKGLFSATMPKAIQDITSRYLQNPKHIKIKEDKNKKKNISQKYMLLNGVSRFHALTRILESEASIGVIVFARTKNATVELAEDLNKIGFKAGALNGDMQQSQRERTIEQIKSGKIDILIATDVAARGLDVDRISLVINYDLPHDSETYVHRIGRTGRGAKEGDSIVFITNHEKRYLRNYERATEGKLNEMLMPTVKDINAKRLVKLKQEIANDIEQNLHQNFKQIISSCQEEYGLSEFDIAACLAKLLHEKRPIYLEEKYTKKQKEQQAPREKRTRFEDRKGVRERAKHFKEKSRSPVQNFSSYRIEVGRTEGMKPAHIVGAIANEVGLSSQHIGDIKIHKSHSTLELPRNLSAQMSKSLKKLRILGHEIHLSELRKKRS